MRTNRWGAGYSLFKISNKINIATFVHQMGDTYIQIPLICQIGRSCLISYWGWCYGPQKSEALQWTVVIITIVTLKWPAANQALVLIPWPSCEPLSIIVNIFTNCTSHTLPQNPSQFAMKMKKKKNIYI